VEVEKLAQSLNIDVKHLMPRLKFLLEVAMGTWSEENLALLAQMKERKFKCARIARNIGLPDVRVKARVLYQKLFLAN
jgi:hypothetical protein